MDELWGFAVNNQGVLYDNLDRFSEQNLPYRLWEVSDDILVSIRRDTLPRGIFLNVGYPFSIRREKFSSSQFNVQIFLRGEKIRERQRMMLKEAIGGKGVKWVTFNEIGKFRELTSRILRNQRKAIYVDAYTFVGDSVIGLYFMDCFERRFSISDYLVLSKAYEHLRFFHYAYPDESQILRKFCKDYKIVIMPDLIDTHWEKRLELLCAIKEEKAYVFIIGRNLILDLGEKRVYHLRRNDPLLRNKNIEDYMNDCLSCYMNNPVSTKNIVARDKVRSVFFINPVSSSNVKDMPVNLAFLVCKELTENSQVKIYISTGVQNEPKDKRWIEEFEEKTDTLSSHQKERIELVAATSLSELAHSIRRVKAAVALTADTSVAHILNRMGVLNLTVYNKSYWDSESVQSLAIDSPLAFCRYGPVQYPAILHTDENMPRFCSALVAGMKTLARPWVVSRFEIPASFLRALRKLDVKHISGISTAGLIHTQETIADSYSRLQSEYKETKLSWLFSLYNPIEMTSGVLGKVQARKVKYLVRASWLISPPAKFFSGVQPTR